MAYTPSARKTKSPVNNFAGQAVDGNRVVMNYANNMQSQDAATSPVTSPVTNMAASVQTLKVPQNAVQLVVSSTVAILVTEDASGAQGINVPANTLATFDVAQQANIYLLPSSATNTVSFYFKIV